MTPLPFMDVAVRDGAVELPELKLRELLFVGALRVDAHGVLERDPSRPLPPFRLPGLFPPGSRFARESHGDRVRLRPLDPRPPGAAHPVEAALGALRASEVAVASLDGPPRWAELHAEGFRVQRVEHVLFARRLVLPEVREASTRCYGLAEDGSITAVDAAAARHVFAVVRPAGADERALREAGLALAYARWVMTREPSGGAGPSTS